MQQETAQTGTRMTAPQILVAEDEGALRALIAEMLTDRELRVTQASDGVQALEILKENPGISLLLSDVKMPRMDGYELAEESLSLFPELKVLMMTAYAQDHPPPPLLRAREIRTLVKPVDLDRLCDLVCDMLSRP
jgi:two-component system cell cycle response regulator CpdR